MADPSGKDNLPDDDSPEGDDAPDVLPSQPIPEVKLRPMNGVAAILDRVRRGVAKTLVVTAGSALAAYIAGHAAQSTYRDWTGFDPKNVPTAPGPEPEEPPEEIAASPLPTSGDTIDDREGAASGGDGGDDDENDEEDDDEPEFTPNTFRGRAAALFKKAKAKFKPTGDKIRAGIAQGRENIQELYAELDRKYKDSLAEYERMKEEYNVLKRFMFKVLEAGDVAAFWGPCMTVFLAMFWGLRRLAQLREKMLRPIDPTVADNFELLAGNANGMVGVVNALMDGRRADAQVIRDLMGRLEAMEKAVKGGGTRSGGAFPTGPILNDAERDMLTRPFDTASAGEDPDDPDGGPRATTK